jgi:prefoldin subunit 1
MAIVKAQIAAKSREGRLLQLTSKELAGLPADTQVYEGVGKMYAPAPAGGLPSGAFLWDADAGSG